MNKVISSLFFFILLLGFTSMYTITEMEQVVITQFGEPVGDPISAPGLHFKIPFVQRVNVFDKRWLEWDGEVDADSGAMRTLEKTPIWVDTYARWRIKDPLQFYKRLHTEERAQTRIDDIIESETRNVIAAHCLIEVVRATSREVSPAVEQVLAKCRELHRSAMAAQDKHDAKTKAAQGKEVKNDAPQGQAKEQEVAPVKTKTREELVAMILAQVQEKVPDLGIEVVDVRFQQVNYTNRVELKTYEAMISERKRIAARYRAEGEEESLAIIGDMREQLAKIESQAYREAQEIKGEADAKATFTYAEAYGRDIEFYKLVKSLESYEQTIGDDTTLLLSTESDFYETLKGYRR